MTMLENNILQKLLENKDLSTKQIEYVHENIEPKYKNDCGICRINVMQSLGIPSDTAFDIVNKSTQLLDITEIKSQSF